MARIKPKALLIQSKRQKGPTRIGLATIVTCNLIIILIVLSLYSTYKHWHRRATPQLDADDAFVGTRRFGRDQKADLPGYAVLSTSKGSITVELYKNASPEAVEKFIKLCEKGHFKGMLFHRIIKKYVIQIGGAAEDWTLKEKLSQLSISPKHDAFMLGTSRAKPNSTGFELFITTAPIPDLNDKLIVFGRVIKGEDVVQEIEEVDTDEQYRPKSPIGITDISLKQET